MHIQVDEELSAGNLAATNKEEINAYTHSYYNFYFLDRLYSINLLIHPCKVYAAIFY